jgi:hypothetical protein
MCKLFISAVREFVQLHSTATLFEMERLNRIYGLKAVEKRKTIYL